MRFFPGICVLILTFFILTGCSPIDSHLGDSEVAKPNSNMLCTDSDGGKDIYTPGVAIKINKSSNHYKFPLAYDRCKNESFLYETICEENPKHPSFDKTITKWVPCPEGEKCVSGACTSNPSIQPDYVPITCYDTDGGQDIKIKGWSLTSGFAVADFCCNKDDTHCGVDRIISGNQLREYYCENGERKWKMVDCNCDDGKCLN